MFSSPMPISIRLSNLRNQYYHFWIFQLVGWLSYSLVTFFSITYWDNNVTPSHLGHILLQAVLGALCSWPLRFLYNYTLKFPALRRILIALVASIVFSALWTALRMATFMWISDERGLWTEFNYWYFGSLFVFISWTSLFYGIKYYLLLIAEHEMLLAEIDHAQEEQLKRLQAESIARDSQLQMLRYQLNPHFLFNTLNSIKALVKLKDTVKADKMIQLLSYFLRHSLEQDATEKVSLEQELSSLMLYIDIEKVRFEERLKLDIHIEPEALKAMVPGLILQPIIENSMKYAIAATEEGGVIRLTGRKVLDELELEVTDNGPGINEDDTTKSRGIGLSNTMDRLKANYGNSYRFVTSNAGSEGLSIKICMPYQIAAFE